MGETPQHQVLLDLVVPDSLEGERIDKTVALLADLTRSVVNDMIEQGLVTVDGKAAKSRSTLLRRGQSLHVSVQEGKTSGLQPDPNVEFDVVYEDESILVIDKPVGLVVHHGSGHNSGTLVDGLAARYPDILSLPEAGAGDPDRPGIVHRLDKGTSGLLAVARTVPAYNSLVEQLSSRKAGRSYFAAVLGSPESDLGEVDAPIGRSARDPTRMVVSQRGRPARTSFRVVERFPAVTYIEATLHSGRTHQIRVHMAAIGHPVLGDDRYGSKKAPALQPGRQFLHAHRLTIEHPEGGERTWESKLPADLEGVLEKLRSELPDI